MYGYESVGKAGALGDLEAGTLYPGLSRGENELRWGFIRKVYGILTAQILLTTLISAVTVLYTPVNHLLTGSPGLILGLALLPLVCLLGCSKSLALQGKGYFSPYDIAQLL